MALKGTAQIIFYAVQNGLVPAGENSSTGAFAVGAGSSAKGRRDANGRPAASSMRSQRPDKPRTQKP